MRIAPWAVWTVLCVFAASSVANAANAQTANAQTANAQAGAVADAIACQGLKRDKARLKCLEEAVEGLKAAYPQAVALADERAQAVAQRDVADQVDGFGLANAEQSAARTEDQFGSEALPARTERDDDGAIKQITSKVIEAGSNSYGKVFFVLDNGQVWRQLGSDDTYIQLPRSNRQLTVEVRKSAFGNYRMTVKELRRTIRVSRIK